MDDDTKGLLFIAFILILVVLIVIDIYSRPEVPPLSFEFEDLGLLLEVSHWH